MKLGDIEYINEGIFKRVYWLVCYEKSKHSSSSAIFYNFELARIYSEIIKMKGGNENGKTNKNI